MFITMIFYAITKSESMKITVFYCCHKLSIGATYQNKLDIKLGYLSNDVVKKLETDSF